KKKPLPIRQFNPRVSPELELLVERVLAKNPEKRIRSMAEFAREIDRLIAERRYEGKYGLAKVLARKWTPIAAAALVFAFGVRFAAWAWFERGTAVSTDASEDLVRAAAIALESVEKESSRVSPERRRWLLNQEVFRRLDEVLRRDPDNLRAKVCRTRALVVDGRTSVAAESLRTLEAYGGRDYPSGFLHGLLRIEAEAPPRPSP